MNLACSWHLKVEESFVREVFGHSELICYFCQNSYYSQNVSKYNYIIITYYCYVESLKCPLQTNSFLSNLLVNIIQA
jgi:hypothetical protein